MMPEGDVLLITFPFTDLSGNKLRPAVVLVDTSLDFTVCFITTQVKWQEPTDVLLDSSPANGLKKQSLLRVNKIATLDKQLAQGLLGTLSQTELAEVDTKLKLLFQLP